MSDPREREIPVFSVWKNNAILKNIFLVNAPPSFNDFQTQKLNGEEENGGIHQGFEETLMIGRHPDCDIRLEHPSVSRFHLRIHSIPSSLHLYLTDLSSVHGTWVSGRRIEPNVRTRLEEGDSLKIGGSSRVYKLHWIPFSQAYDMEHPFVPPLDFPEPQEDEEEEITGVRGFSDSCVQVENPPGLEKKDIDVVDAISKCMESMTMFEWDEPLGVENDVLRKNEDEELVYSDFGSLGSLFGDENIDVLVQKCTPPLSVQNQNSDVLEDKDGLETDSILEDLAPLFLGENLEWVGQEENIPMSSQVNNNSMPFKYEDEGFVASVLKGLDTSFLDENFRLLAKKIIPSAPPLVENMTFNLVQNLNNTIADGEEGCELLDLRNGKQNLLQDVQDRDGKFWDGTIVAPCSPVTKRVLIDNEDHQLGKENQYSQQGSEPVVSSPKKCLERDCVNQNSSPNEHEPGQLWSFWSGNMGIESVCSSLSDAEAFSESENGPQRNDYRSPPLLSSVKKQCGSFLVTPEQNSVRSIWSRRGKEDSAPQIRTSRTEERKVKTYQKEVKHNPISKTLFQEVDDQEEKEIFTPDKENFTPNTIRSMRKLAALNEVNRLESGKSSLCKMPGSPDIYYVDGMSPASDKENYTPKVLQERKTVRHASVNQSQTIRTKQRKGERVPFQILLADSPQKIMSETCLLDAAVRGGNCNLSAKGSIKDNCSGWRIQKWSMVVDTTTLLNKESRKALQLLEGLKGTQFIIPRIVIKELDSLKRQVSFFRRNSEVSSALEWIQDCMIKTPWWIHVPSSIEEGQPVAPTPPASPHTQFSCGTITSAPFLGCQPELLSPTAEDHVLDYALSFRKTQDDGQLVLLSNDITLKIKAMAEGLICEGAEEFRESLANPFSDRFLWADSSPRGQTWSCSDDIVLREKFYPSSLKMTPKAMENVRGLKLILLHNSQYFERVTAAH